ncbi:MAG: hypothetical protein CMM46_02450 [Rhodospirillaceae bacterium]|nr:hypothetical protein [Rhodospirillaceae bacterium]|tara:strand:- start:371 stop:904 length:534 start_codon:yes stop_codon:yes gene_type:complete
MAGLARFDARRTELAPQFNAQSGGESEFLGARTKRLNNFFMRAPTTRQMAIPPILLPSESAQALHRDAFFYPFHNPGPVTQQGSLWAVTDFTAENGATRIVPGSHLWDEERQPQAAEVVPAEMPADSAIIYAHNIIHGSGANSSDEQRTAVALNFTLGWLRQQENQFLTLPPEKARE